MPPEIAEIPNSCKYCVEENALFPPRMNFNFTIHYLSRGRIEDIVATMMDGNPGLSGPCRYLVSPYVLVPADRKGRLGSKKAMHRVQKKQYGDYAQDNFCEPIDIHSIDLLSFIRGDTSPHKGQPLSSVDAPVSFQAPMIPSFHKMHTYYHFPPPQLLSLWEFMKIDKDFL
jgi:hypothetical protein